LKKIQKYTRSKSVNVRRRIIIIHHSDASYANLLKKFVTRWRICRLRQPVVFFCRKCKYYCCNWSIACEQCI